MGVKITIRPHIVGQTEFNQFQILIGQRVCGYLGKLATCLPKLVVRELPQDALTAIMRESQKTLRELLPGEELLIDKHVKPLESATVGAPRAKEQEQPADQVASAELESFLSALPADEKSAKDKTN